MPMDKREAILKGEQDFARQVALAIVMATPASAWRTLIPFMFMIDALIRGRTIRNYTAFHLFPKRLALQAAGLGPGEDLAERRTEIAREAQAWLEGLGLHSAGTLEAQMQVVDLLAGHYRKLLAAPGTTHEEMTASAYGNRMAYAGLLEELARREEQVVRQMLALTGQDEGLRTKLEIERRQLERLREKQVDRVFAGSTRERA